MSDTIKQCLKCKTSVKIFKFYKEGEDDKILDFWNGFIWFEYLRNFCKNESYNSDFENNMCPFCKEELVDTMLSLDDFDAIAESSDYNRDLLLAMIELRKKDVIEFETKMQPFREAMKKKQEVKEKKRQEYFSSIDAPHCPRCGSTSITAGQRGYSLLTGFIGSGKTVNRCANCGHKWKP